jgi:type 1 glutamine amidotransferase
MRPDELRVLLVTGIDYPGHAWRETAPHLVATLQKDARLRVDVLSDPYRLDRFDLSPYQALVMHFMNWERPEPGDRAKENLRGFVDRGGGLVLVHFACGAFSNWTEFPKLAGRVWDGKNTHDPRGPFRVDLVTTEHPVTRGLVAYETDDELYIGLTGESPVEDLATARSKVTGRDHPMAFVHRYGRGRVFHTPLGHDLKALQVPGTMELIRRGCAWAAGGPPVAPP